MIKYRVIFEGIYVQTENWAECGLQFSLASVIVKPCLCSEFKICLVLGLMLGFIQGLANSLFPEG